MKILVIQDISCYGQCSITVALPILSSKGIETAILPSSLLSTHTTGFTNYTNLDLTDEMKKIIAHWIEQGISFDAIYTGYIGNEKQFDIIIKCKEKLLKKDGLFIVDPAFADNGKIYPALDYKIITIMKKLCQEADYIIPNLTEACLLTNTPYKSNFTKNEIYTLLDRLMFNPSLKIILTSVSFNKDELGVAYKDNEQVLYEHGELIPKSFHGTGDVFSSYIIGNIINKVSIQDNLKESITFIIDCIKETMKDINHTYGVKFETILAKKY